MEIRIGHVEFDALANPVYVGFCEFDSIALVEGGGYSFSSKRSGAKKAPAKSAPTVRNQTLKLAEQLTAAGKLTKAAKKKRREEVERQVLELLPGVPAANEFAASVAQAVVRREAAFFAEHIPEPLHLEPDFEPLPPPKFDPEPVIQQMLKRWKPPVVRHPDDEFEVEALLLLG